ncbi:F-box/FBD/LRR-repeat protein-like protein [Salvia divinorum]|uniref:F-box/FBD/LRR-repeat protein-like protein n=1 Tax=Salvia divinorum TaxID=28513 RepID=A0ABD1FUK9_SALDI
MVNHVVNSHRGGRIKEFRLEITEFDQSWFEFALAKKVEIFHSGGEKHFGYGSWFLRVPSTNGLEFLKDLSLTYLHITDQDFELLISNCLALEYLTINYSMELTNVSIVGLSKLKHVNFSNNVEVRSLVIHDAISLTSLTLCKLNSGCTVQLSNTPSLPNLIMKKVLMHPCLMSFSPECHLAYATNSN